MYAWWRGCWRGWQWRGCWRRYVQRFNGGESGRWRGVVTGGTIILALYCLGGQICTIPACFSAVELPIAIAVAVTGHRTISESRTAILNISFRVLFSSLFTVVGSLKCALTVEFLVACGRGGGGRHRCGRGGGGWHRCG